MDNNEKQSEVLREQVARILRKKILGLNTTQAKAAQQMGCHQRQVSAILVGNMQGISLARLVDFAGRLGIDVQIRVA